MTEHTIKIETVAPFRPLRALYVVSLQLFVFGVGIVAGSAAMQWFGFICLVILAVGVVVSKYAENTGLTPAEARERIDKIEAASK